MQRVDNRIPAVFLFLIARRQEDENVAVDRIPLQVALQSRTVNLDVLDRNWLCSRNYLRNVGCYLSHKRRVHGHGQ